MRNNKRCNENSTSRSKSSTSSSKNRTKSKSNKNNNKYDNSYRNREKDKIEDKRSLSEATVRSTFDNNPADYVSSSEMMEQLSQFSFNSILGTPKRMVTNYDTDNSTPEALLVVPEVYTLVVATTPQINNVGVPEVTPQSEDWLPKTGLEIASERWFQRISSRTGRAVSQYNPIAIAMLMLAQGEILQTFEYVRAMMGTKYMYNMRNRIFPKQFAMAMGCDYDDLLINYPSYRNKFNMLVQRFNAIPQFSGVTYFDKCRRLFSTIYKDDPDSPEAQHMVLIPAGCYKYDETSNSLKWINFLDEAGIHKLSWYFDQLNEMIDSLTNSSMYNIVYQDMFNYAANVNYVWNVVAGIDDSYQTPIAYNMSVLQQLHNVKFAPMQIFDISEYVFDDATSRIKIQRQIDVPAESGQVGTGERSAVTKKYVNILNNAFGLVDFAVPNPDAGTRIDSMRYLLHIEPDSVNWSNDILNATNFETGDHSFIKIIAYSFGAKGDSSYPYSSGYTVQSSMVIDSGSVSADDLSCFMFTQWDWSPVVLYMKPVNSLADFRNARVVPIGDLNYFATYNNDEIRNVYTLFETTLFDLYKEDNQPVVVKR